MTATRGERLAMAREALDQTADNTKILSRGQLVTDRSKLRGALAEMVALVEELSGDGEAMDRYRAAVATVQTPLRRT